MVITPTNRAVSIVDLDGDYTSPSELKVWSIKFYPSNTADRAYIRFDDAGGQLFTILQNSISLDPVIEYLPPTFRGTIFFDEGDSTITTPANARLIIIFRHY